MTTDLVLFAAIDAGDDGAYDALADYYDEAGLPEAAAGVRKAKPLRRRPVGRAAYKDYAWLVLSRARYVSECRSDGSLRAPYRSDLFASAERVAEYQSDYRSATSADLAAAWAYVATPGVLE